MGVAERMDEVAGAEVRHLGDHHGQQRVARDVERHAKEGVGRPLIELAGQAAVGDVELEQAVARGERHLRNVSRVPCRHDQSPAVRVAADLGDDVGDLVDGASVRGGPTAPLAAVDGAEFTCRVGPFIPDRDAVVAQVADVGVASQEPDQFVHDRFNVQFLRRHQRKAVGEVEPHLVAKHRSRAGAGAVGLGRAVVEDVAQEVVVLSHGPTLHESGRAQAPALQSSHVQYPEVQSPELQLIGVRFSGSFIRLPQDRPWNVTGALRYGRRRSRIQELFKRSLGESVDTTPIRGEQLPGLDEASGQGDKRC